MRGFILPGYGRCSVFETILFQSLVSIPPVGQDVAAGPHPGFEKPLQRGETRDLLLVGLASPALFHCHDDHRFALGPAPAPPRTLFATAHVALVGLHQTAELIAPIAVGHRLAQLIQQQPRGLIADPDLLFQLHDRDPLLVVAQAINRPEPTS